MTDLELAKQIIKDALKVEPSAPEPVIPTELTTEERLAAVETTTAEIIDVLFGGV